MCIRFVDKSFIMSYKMNLYKIFYGYTLGFTYPLIFHRCTHILGICVCLLFVNEQSTITIHAIKLTC